MSDFLAPGWFEGLNARFDAAASAPLPNESRACQVVIDIPDSPHGLPRAVTLSISAAGVRVAPGADPTADTVLRLNYLDAAALTSGELDSASAFREGRVKVRGDVNVLVPLTNWLQEILAP